MTLREKQTAALLKMLELPAQTPLAPPPPWKVLVLDRKSTNIVLLILNVNDLLAAGVTMHTVLTQPSRSPLPDVPAVYLVQPTEENIKRIAQDIEKDYYSDYYVHFLSLLDRSLLEDFANLVSLTGRASRVQRVYDQYLDYVVSEPQLFLLGLAKSYVHLNSKEATEESITALADEIAAGIFNVVVTMDTVPVIRAPRGGAAEFVAVRLDAKLRDHVINIKGAVSGERPVLVLMDRNFDLQAMLAHLWIYLVMISDVFSLLRNAITLDAENGKKKIYLDSSDFFWSQNAASPFPVAVENMEADFNAYKTKAAELTLRAGVTLLSDLDPQVLDTYQMQQSIKQLPELTNRKKSIDNHMTILDALLKQLKANNLDLFYEVEQSCKSDAQNKVEQLFLEKLADGKTSNAKDKLRTYLILYLQLNLGEEFQRKAEQELEKLELDMSPLQYVKQVKEIGKLTQILQQVGLVSSGANSGTKGSIFSGISLKLFDGSKITNGVGLIMLGLKNLLPDKQAMPVTNIVESIMEPSKSSQETLNTTDDYLYFDPCIRGNHSKVPERRTFHQGIVFVVGGGNYLEYFNLQEWVSGLNGEGVGVKWEVIYGSTDMVSPGEFVEELSELAK